MEYRVTYTFGAVMIVEAANEEEAERKVEELTTDELFAVARDGFEVQSVEEN
jgi:hypothetical protein